MNPVIDYAAQAGARIRFRRWIKPVGVAAALLFLLSVILGMEVRHDLAWVCASCASRRGQVDWVFGMTTSRSVHTSALEKWLVEHGHAHTHDWRNIRGNIQDLFGRSLGSAHGSAPPIYSLAFNTLLEEFIRCSTDQEVLDFANVMRDGSEAEQEQAIRSAADKALAR